MKSNFKHLKSALLVLCMIFSSQVFATEYFRYKDNNGVQVINTHVPPEYVKYGYEVITSRGQVIRVIPPAPTEDELAAREEQKRQKEEQKRQAAAQRAVDARLMQLYSHPDDAKRALERKLAELDYQISQKRGQLVALNSKKEKEEEYAAARERMGNEVSEEIMEEIARFERQISEINKQIEEIEESKKLAQIKFEKDIQRMIEIFNEKNKKKYVE